MSEKLTPWFPGNVKPVRAGIYQQLSGFGKEIGYQRWDGKQWSVWCFSKEAAESTTSVAANFFQNDPWRGLAKEPK